MTGLIPHDMEAVNGFGFHLDVGTRAHNSDGVVRVFSNIIIYINAHHIHRIYKKHIPCFITMAISNAPPIMIRKSHIQSYSFTSSTNPPS